MNTLVLEQIDNEEVPTDVYQKLSNDRILFITNYVGDEVATDLVATLFLKDREDDTSKITLFINSPGGDIRNVFMICDAMSIISSPVETICMGAALDEAALILISGNPGMRLATKNAVISISQLVSSFHNQTNMIDAKNLMDQFKTDNNRLLEILSKNTKKTLKQVKTDFDRKTFFTAAKALKYGLIDKIATPNK